MSRAKQFLSIEERYELQKLFFKYPMQKLSINLNSDKPLIPIEYEQYLPYLESELTVALTIALDEYDKNGERSQKKRPYYFKAYLDAVIDSHLKSTILSMNAAIARVEGRASRTPLKSDKELYNTLTLVAQGRDLLELQLEELKE